MESKKYSLNKADVISLTKGLLITLAGATLTYLSTVITKVDFGANTPFVVAMFSLLVNTARKFLAGQES